MILSERDLDLVEIALESAATAVQSGATLRNRRDLDPLAREYLTALEHVREIRKRDEFGVPKGEHTATCGCRLKGRALLEPCAAHESLADVGPISAVVPDAVTGRYLVKKSDKSDPPENRR